MIAIDIPNQTKIIKTDEDIPFEPSNLIGDALNVQFQQYNDEIAQSVQQKYDLVSKNSDTQENLERDLKKCNFQQVTGPEPEDSECPIDMVSMRSTQTQNFIAKSNQHVMRRMNSQENIITTLSQFPNQTNSNGGYTKSMTNIKSNEQKERIHPAIKGIKLSKIRIIQKSTVYVIGLSPNLADESLMRRYEYFGQYGKILQVAINKDNAFTSSVKDDLGGESTSSTKSQISYAAYITYSSPQDAALAIMALDQSMFDQRLIRASYGRTKYCKYFLKNSRCPNKDCPYKHSESKEQDILTPDDMQKKALFQYCIQLAIQMSKIAEMNESQFRNLLKHKRDLRNLQAITKHVLPSIESIFDNKDLLKKINQFKTSLLSAKSKQQKPDDKSKQIATELSKKQLQTAANKVSRELRYQNSIQDTKKVKFTENEQIKKPRSGSNKHEVKQSNKNLIETEIKVQERQSLTPRRHSISRMFCQNNPEIKIQDLKNQHNTIQYPDSQALTQVQQSISNIEKQKIKYTQKIINKQNQQDSSHLVPASQRTNRLMNKEENEQVKESINQTVTQQKQDSSSLGRNNRGRFGSYRRDRQKSASKSIQRQTSVSSLIDYTLKFLNDDMAIDLTKLRIEDPLIEKSVEDDYAENQSQINKMIFHNQNLNQDHFDGKSSIFSNGVDSRGCGNMGEINLRKINNIYTSPFFLINSEKNETDKNKSIYKIWENFDKIDNALNLQNQNSDYMFFQQKFDCYSYEENVKRNNTINYSNHMSPRITERNNHGFIGGNQNKNQMQQQHSSVNLFNQAPMASSLTLNAKPFIKTNNSLNSGSQAAGQKVSTAANSGPGGGQTNTQNVQQQQISQFRPKKINSTNQPLENNLSQQAKALTHNQSAKCKELNEKNLYLFDKQQEELFDKQQHWNKIFLNNRKENKTTNGSGQNIGLFNTQSVFCFPMGVQDDKETKNIKQSASKDNFNFSDQKQRHSFGVLNHEFKRKSTLCLNTKYQSPKNNDSKYGEGKMALTPHLLKSNVNHANSLRNLNTMTQSLKKNGTSESFKAQIQKINEFQIPTDQNQQTTKEDKMFADIDRNSAGERFGYPRVSFYQELQKINSLFNSTTFKRRNSCSHSHSRVRIVNEEQMLINQQNQLDKQDSVQIRKRSPSNTSESMFAKATDAIVQNHYRSENQNKSSNQEKNV